MYDLNLVIQNPNIQHLAEILRRQLNLNIGLVSESDLIWLGTRQPIHHPMCQTCPMEQQKCVYQTWLSNMTSRTSSTFSMTCHAGLHSVAIPVYIQSKRAAAVIASGFTPEFELSDIADVPEQTPFLTQREYRIVLEILIEIAAQTQNILASSISVPDPANAVLYRHDFSEVIGSSPAIQSLLHQMDDAADCDTPILLEGAPGVGKEFIARMIHQASDRRNGPFVVQNCSALNETLLDSELFGHKRGAFAGAFVDKPGLLDVAHHGTFFLDEIESLSPQLQLKILHVIENGVLTPIGDSCAHDIDIRIIAASTQELSSHLESGFRQDLYYKLSISHLIVPTLSQRREDIESLAGFLLTKKCIQSQKNIKTLTPEVIEILKNYDWPGNVSELENEIERLIVLSGPEITIQPDIISSRILRTHEMKRDAIEAVSQTHDDPEFQNEFRLLPGQSIQNALEEIERRMIAMTLRQNGGNRTKAAEILGISRRNLIRKIESLGVEE